MPKTEHDGIYRCSCCKKLNMVEEFNLKYDTCKSCLDKFKREFRVAAGFKKTKGFNEDYIWSRVLAERLSK